MADQASNECSSSSNVVEESSESTIEINIKTLDSQTYTFQVTKNMPVSSLKEKIANEIGVPVAQQRLIFRGRVLKDDHPLSEYHLENGHTLHLVVRQPTELQATRDTSSGEANANNSSQGNDTNGGAPRNRIGQISHSIVLGTFNVGDQGETVVPDISRVIGSVLNSFGIGNQPANSAANGIPHSIFANAPGQTPPGNGTDGTPNTAGGQSQPGNQSQSGQMFSGQSFQMPPQVVQIPLTAAAAIPIPSVHSPIPDSLNTLSEFINRMEQVLSRNGYQQDNSSSTTRDQPRAELPRNARGLASPEALAIVMRNAQRLLSGQTVAALSHVAGRLEQEGASSDPSLRAQIQTEATQVGLAMQHLGALVLELGRTILTLRMGQSPAESYVNAGPAVYISPSGPNPIMVQPFPLQAHSLFSGAAPASNHTTSPVGMGTIPRHINIHIHAAGNRPSSGEGNQGERDNSTTANAGSGSTRVLPVRNVIAAAVPSRPTGVSFSASAHPGLGVSVSQAPPDSASMSSLISEVNSQLRDLANNMQGENRGAAGTEPTEQLVSAEPTAADEVYEEANDVAVNDGTEEPNDLKPQPKCNKGGGSEGVGCASTGEDDVRGSSTYLNRESTCNPEGSPEIPLKSSEKKALPEGSTATPLGLGLRGLERKKRSKQLMPSVKDHEIGRSTTPGNLQSLVSGSPASNISPQQPANITSQQSSDDHRADAASAISQVLESPALEGLLAGISGQTGVGSPNVLRNMLQQFTQNPQIMNTVQQIAQQVDGREIENMLSGGGQGGGGIDFSRMVQQMMPLVSGAFTRGSMPSQPISATEPGHEQFSERSIEVDKPDDQAFQINVQPVAEIMEHSDAPGDVYRAMVENAVQTLTSVNNPENLVEELGSDESLAHDYMEMLRRDIQHRLQGDSRP